MTDQIRAAHPAPPAEGEVTDAELDELERKFWKVGSSIEIEPEGIREILDRHETFDHRAFARAAIALDIPRRALAPPDEGEVAELVAELQGHVLHINKLDAEGWPVDDDLPPLLTRVAELLAQRHPAPVPVAIPGEEYHEDMGPVTWWRFPLAEPPWIGTPNDSDWWPGYYTHFTAAPITPLDDHALPLPTEDRT